MDEKFDIVADLLQSFKVLIDWCMFIFLSQKSDGVLCFGQIHTRLGVDHFPSFPVDFLPPNFADRKAEK